MRDSLQSDSSRKKASGGQEASSLGGAPILRSSHIELAVTQVSSCGRLAQEGETRHLSDSEKVPALTSGVLVGWGEGGKSALSSGAGWQIQ